MLDHPVQCGSHNAVEDAQATMALYLWDHHSNGPKEILWENLGSGGEGGMEPGLEL